MPIRKYHFLIPIALGVVVLLGLMILWPAANASAQCGSQASSCKNCHEVQGKDPVNNDGTGWHQGHAFADFCYACHGGNNQSMDQDAAHTGMTPPMDDVQTACQACHPTDLMDRAQVYATILGIDLAAGGGATSGGSSSNDSGGAASTAPTAPDSTTSAAPAPALALNDSEVIDYNLRYSGKMPVNWGNVILSVLIGLVAVGGGGYVYYNERKLRGLPLTPAARATAARPIADLPDIAGYSPEIVALLPKIARLNPAGLHALQRLLENPEQAAELLHSLSRLDPELVRRIRSLDRESRALLLALSGD